MPDGYNFQTLKMEILALSSSKRWSQARLEWRLLHVFRADEAETCLCSHFPIMEICTLTNTKNGNEAEVGNVCVKRFMGIDAQKIFASIKRIKKDISKSVSADTLALYLDAGEITQRDFDFYENISRKRQLTTRQAAWKEDINRRILRRSKRIPLAS
jgi:hypothetical protein